MIYRDFKSSNILIDSVRFSQIHVFHLILASSTPSIIDEFIFYKLNRTTMRNFLISDWQKTDRWTEKVMFRRELWELTDMQRRSTWRQVNFFDSESIGTGFNPNRRIDLTFFVN